MALLSGDFHSPEYLALVQSMSNLLKMNHKYKVVRVMLDGEEKYIGFKFEKVS